MVLKKGEEEEKSIADRLPELSEDELQDATRAEGVRFAQLLASQPVGHLWVDQEQSWTAVLTVSKNTLRCGRVYDYEYGFWMLSAMRATCAAAGIDLQMGGGTVVAPMPEGSSEDSNKESGEGGNDDGDEVQTSMTKDFDEEFHRGWA